jgi:trimethylamine--corrinoid protein Co-methyltransferase
VRRDGTFDDFCRFLKLAQVYDDFDTAGGLPCEPNDLPMDSRHLDMQLALMTLTDKPYSGGQVSLDCVHDALALAAMAFGGAEAVTREPVMYSVVNVNSPLLYDERMLDALLAYAAAGQPVIVTPFLLMGAMSPVSIPATLAQQLAEALAGIALTQLIRPGAPVILGSFLSNTDMQSGSPALGTPESAIGLLCTGQMARRYGLPFRSGGGLTSSQTCDAQAAYEAMIVMTPTFLAGTNYVMHAAGWLEAGLVACYEKFIVDIEILRMLQVQFTPLEIDEESLAYGAHQEVGAGGHFLGAVHTLERFRECFYRPLLSSTENFQRWERLGGRDATERAGEIYAKTLEEYEEPAMDAAIRSELEEYVTRRRAELGD